MVRTGMEYDATRLPETERLLVEAYRERFPDLSIRRVTVSERPDDDEIVDVIVHVPLARRALSADELMAFAGVARRAMTAKGDHRFPSVRNRFATGQKFLAA